ncbi:two-component system response regulator [Scytonema hofmannii PCC 7110]|uniref:Two-component system response regulator n=1 Tax=Scytonema hofmannii PCC 7110 TaxID=128403 RepID=A0A139X8P7_9CYAN|nr:response regulator [Scytonema hofmannii]KYC41060.1 two-component system response regulator [Scytonema hofmannii PCC 7110]
MTKRVLVIDDEDGVRNIIQISLEVVAGWDVLSATSGMEGIAIAAVEQPDAILLDVMMPMMDGPTTFKQLQANTVTCHIPTILLTAKTQLSEQRQLLNLGVAGIITKPFNPQDLVSKVCNILDWVE